MIDLKILFISSIFFFLSLFFIYYQVEIDSEHFNRKQYFKSHVSRWALRFVYFITIMLMSYRCAFGYMFLHIFLFDHLLNYKVKDWEFWYIGGTSNWDRFWTKRPNIFIAVKIIALLISLYLFFFYGQHIHKLI